MDDEEYSGRLSAAIDAMRPAIDGAIAVMRERERIQLEAAAGKPGLQLVLRMRRMERTGRITFEMAAGYVYRFGWWFATYPIVVACRLYDDCFGRDQENVDD